MDKTTDKLQLLPARWLALWGLAKKTKPLKAKPTADILADTSVAAKFMLSTLEGVQALVHDSMICVGASDDVWQQTRKDLLKKYTVTDITPDGWLVCTPKPDNQVRIVELTEAFLEPEIPLDAKGMELTFEIVGLWGRPIGNGCFVQECAQGDFIAQREDNFEDVWVIRRKVFLNTYEVIQAPKLPPCPTVKAQPKVAPTTA